MQCIFPAGGGGGVGGAAAGGAEDKKEEKKDEPEEEEEDEVSCNACSAYSMHLLGQLPVAVPAALLSTLQLAACGA